MVGTEENAIWVPKLLLILKKWYQTQTLPQVGIMVWGRCRSG